MRKIFTILSLLFVVISLHAQVTTGSLSGTIKDSKTTMPGVTVKATHVPSGTNYVVSTNDDGRFTISNMRPGGPYKVVITYVGMDPKIIDNIILPLGDPYILNLNMAAGSRELGEVSIKGASKNSALNASRTGTSTNLGKKEINALPTLSRSLSDLIRLAPQSNGAAIGGGNSRQNTERFNGADFKNNFRLVNNLPGK